MVDSLTTSGNSTNRDLKGAGVSLMAATKLSLQGGEGELSAGKERREETSTRQPAAGSTRRWKCFKKSMPKIGKLMSARRKFQVKMQPWNLIVRERRP